DILHHYVLRSRHFTMTFLDAAATTPIYPLSLHDALPIWRIPLRDASILRGAAPLPGGRRQVPGFAQDSRCAAQDRLLQLRAEELSGRSLRPRSGRLPLRRHDGSEARCTEIDEDGERGQMRGVM